MYPDFPEYCFTLNNVTAELIQIRRGEMGYYEFEDPDTKRGLGGLAALEKVHALNTALGITDWRIVKAMEVGSMFGWEIRGAHPDAYAKISDEDGMRQLRETAMRYEKFMKKRRQKAADVADAT